MSVAARRDDRAVLERRGLALAAPEVASPVGLELPAGLSRGEWEQVGEQLARLEAGVQWWIGDWVRYGEHTYGDTYTDAIERTGLSYQTCRNCATIAGRIELSRRRDNLSWSHHAEVAALAPAEQDEWLARAETEQWTRAELRKRVRQPAPPTPAAATGPPTITQADATEWLAEQPRCDLLLTDPPYSTNVEDVERFAARWLPVALDRVKPTGRAFVCIGAYPHELVAYLNVKPATQVLVWTYRNTLGPAPSHAYKLNWQAILYYEGPDAPPLDSPVMVEQFTVQDINAPDGRLGDRWHAWQKPLELGERFVRHATRPGDLVLDPFAGTGTFLLAATGLGRRAHGCERDPAMIDIATDRGCHAR